MRKIYYSVLTTILLLAAATEALSQNSKPTIFSPPYVPTSETVVDAMLKLANVSKTDIVYDLGCGDGRIVITAAKEYGADGVGIEIDPKLVKLAKQNAEKAGVVAKTRFFQGDIFKTDFSKATVVTLYLLPQMNLRLRPILLERLKPGTRVISNMFDMGDWKPEQIKLIDGKPIYMWTIPADKKHSDQQK